MAEGGIPAEYRGGRGIDEEASAALAERRDAIVGTLNSDGTIHMTPVWFLYEDGLLFFETNGATRKARNVVERGVLTMLVSGSVTDVIAMGHGRVIDGEDGQAINRRLRARYLTEAGQGPVGRFAEKLDDVAVELTPSSVVTWTNGMLTTAIQSLPEFTPEAGESWFRPADG